MQARLKGSLSIFQQVSKQVGSQRSSAFKHCHEQWLGEESFEIIPADFFDVDVEELVRHVLVPMEVGDGTDEILAVPSTFDEDFEIPGDVLEK